MQEQIDRELNYLKKKHGTTVEATPEHAIDEGDIVMIQSKSELPKFNKPMIPVSIGKKLFDSRIEDALLGMKIGESKELEIDGKPVTINVLKAKTKTEADLTWDLVKDDILPEYPEADSLESFQQQLESDIVNMMKEDHFLDNVYSGLAEQITTKMEIDVDEEELGAYIDQVFEYTANDAAQEELSTEDFLRQWFKDWNDLSDEELREKYKEYLTNNFSLDKYLQTIFLRDNEEDLEKRYEAKIKEWSDASGEPLEDCKKMVSFNDFITRTAAGEVNLRLFNKFLEKATTEVK